MPLISTGKFSASEFADVGARYALVAALVFFLVFSKLFPPKNPTTELACEEY